MNSPVGFVVGSVEVGPCVLGSIVGSAVGSTVGSTVGCSDGGSLGDLKRDEKGRIQHHICAS